MARKLKDPGDIQTIISKGISLHPILELQFETALHKLVVQGKLELLDRVRWRLIEDKYNRLINE